MVTVTGGRPTSLPTQIPTTIEGVTREEIETRINATDSEDALKYLPSLLVRKRYIGDYNHAILSTRASGTGNSARSAVYADGILLSNYLGNGIANGTNYAPRWGLVTPEEIERVDVMYGPFSAAYPGNSAGAVVDYVTRMPTKLEAHVKAGYSSQPNDLYNTHQTFNSWQTSASLGSRSGDWSWWIDLNRTDSHGQPLTFTTATVASGAAEPQRHAGRRLRAGPEHHQHAVVHPRQRHRSTTRCRTTRSSSWPTTSRPPCAPPTRWAGGRTAREGRPDSYLRNAAGQPVYSGPVNIGGRSYTLAPTAFPLTDDQQTHYMHGLSVKSNTEGRVGLGGGRQPVRLRQGPAARADGGAAAGGHRRRRHAAGPGRHRLEHAGRQGHLAAAGRGRRAHRRLRRRPRCLQAAAS